MVDVRPDTPESTAWQQAQDLEASEILRALPAYAPFRDSMLARSATSRLKPVRRRGGLWFQEQVLDQSAQHAVVTVRGGLADEPRVLVDPNEIEAKRGAPVQLQWCEPSPDGRVLAFAVAEAGTERAEVTLIDVQTGTELPDQVPWSVSFPVSWLPDSSGFWCSGREVVDGEFTMPVHRFDLGGPVSDTPLTLPTGLLFPHPKVSADGRYIAIVTGNSEARIDYVVDPDGRVVPFLLGVEGGVSGSFVGDELIAIVNGDAPRGRVVRIPVATARDTATWTELVPESDDVLCSLEVVSDRVVLGYLPNACAGLRVVTLAGRPVSEVALPGEGTVGTSGFGAVHLSMPMFEAGDGEVSFVYSDFATSPAVYRYLVAEDRLELVDPPRETIAGLRVSLVHSTSQDGTQVAAHVVHRDDLDLSTTHPTLITGYGGFGLSLLPSYLGSMAPWVEAGGIYVLSHLRGGGEHGVQWWRDGSREHKQHTFDDLFAVAERLIELGLTTPSQLAMYGNSNGGLLAGSAVAQRPDLWAAVVPDVPLLDLLAMDRDPVGYEICKGEYGDPRRPEEAAWLRTYSPYELLVEAAYPATLLIAGANDPRCAPWHARVFFERLRGLHTGDAPVLLRVHEGQGHGAGGAIAAAQRTAEWLGFCAQHTGLQP